MTNEINQPEKGNGKKIFWIIVAVLLFLLLIFSPILGSLIEIWRDRKMTERNDKILDYIIETSKPTQARTYEFHNPSAEAKNRTIDCKKLNVYQEELPIINPVCLNLYRTTSEEINKKAAGNVDRIILYGENIIWDAPVLKDNIKAGWDLGKAIYDSAKFNDQIAIPKLLKLYGFSDASFVNELMPNKVLPYSALYFRLGNDKEIQKVCNVNPDENRFAGCAVGMWTTIVPQHVLGDKMSWPDEKLWRISAEKNPDYLKFDYLWPENCMTDEVLIHETAHLLMYAQRVNNITDPLVSSLYFNEHQAGVMEIMGANSICGEGTAVNFHDKDKKATTLFEFNSIYPPTRMGSAWPDPKNTCQLALLNEWNRFMSKGSFEKQFSAFTGALKNYMKQGKTINDDRGFFNFLIQLRNDPDAKNTLQYHNCQF